MKQAYNHLRVARYALQLGQRGHCEHNYAYRQAHNRCNQAMGHAIEHLFVTSAIHDILDMLNAGISSSNYGSINTIIVSIDSLLNDIEAVVV